MMIYETRTPQSILAMCREMDLKTAVLATTDLRGRWTPFTIPISRLDESTFEDGLTIDPRMLYRFGLLPDGSEKSVVGVSTVPDLSLIPLPETAIVDRSSVFPSLILLGSLQETVTRNEWLMDMRQLTKRTAGYVLSSGIADTITFSTHLRYTIGPAYSPAEKETRESRWLESHSAYSGMAPHNGLRQDHAAPPHDHVSSLLGPLTEGPFSSDFEARLVQYLISCGIPVEAHWRYSETENSFAIRLRSDPIVRAADWAVLTKQQIQVFLRSYGLRPHFSPLLECSNRGGGMLPQMSFHRGNESLFSGSGRDGFSDTVQHVMAGISRHQTALLVLNHPTPDTYKQKLLSLTSTPQTATSRILHPIRICFDSRDITQPRIEVDFADGPNPYVAMAATALAGIDGLQNKLGSYMQTGEGTIEMRLPQERPAAFPATLEEALANVVDDLEFLTRGDVFSESWIKTWLAAHECAR